MNVVTNNKWIGQRTIRPDGMDKVTGRAQFAALGIPRIERVMTDNAKAYRIGRAWHDALDTLGAQARFTRNYRPQTNGKAERFNRTLSDEWAYVRPFADSDDRAAALPIWLHQPRPLADSRSRRIMPREYPAPML